MCCELLLNQCGVASLTFSSKFPKKPNSRIAKILESRKTSKLFPKSQNLESLESLPNSRIAQNKQTFQKSQILESLWILKSLKTSKLSKKVKSSNRYEFSNRSKQANFSKKVQLSNRTILKSQLSNRNSNRKSKAYFIQCPLNVFHSMTRESPQCLLVPRKSLIQFIGSRVWHS